MELLTRYMEDVTKDLKIDRLNITEYAMMVPAKKHFWVTKLIIHKTELLKFKKKKSDLSKQIGRVAPMGLSEQNASKVVDSDVLEQLNNKIAELEIIIEYLEKVEKVMSNLTYDIKNSLAGYQMELQ